MGMDSTFVFPLMLKCLKSLIKMLTPLVFKFSAAIFSRKELDFSCNIKSNRIWEGLTLQWHCFAQNYQFQVKGH